jgi:hypothetical protein
MYICRKKRRIGNGFVKATAKKLRLAKSRERERERERMEERERDGGKKTIDSRHAWPCISSLRMREKQKFFLPLVMMLP